MSELINVRNIGQGFRWKLLSTVSAFTLFAATMDQIWAADAREGQPSVWIELGGQLERMEGTGNRFAPGFALLTPTPGPYDPVSPIDAQRPPRYSYGGEAKITFEPAGTDWSFSAAIRYGRSNGKKHVQKQTAVPGFYFQISDDASEKYRTPPYQQKFAETYATQHEAHTVVDFQAGKDVGLGILGNSTLHVGVRFAQFTSQQTANLKARPDIEFYPNPQALPKYLPVIRFHAYTAFSEASRSFSGVGPSLSLNGSSAIMGDADHTQILFDWGVNAAILFGRQKTQVNHQTTARYYRAKYLQPPDFSQYTTDYRQGGHGSSRSVVVPNIGGFAGFTYRLEDFEVSLGYRADFFFGAMDRGIDTHTNGNMSFHGPYATISIGLGG